MDEVIENIIVDVGGVRLDKLLALRFPAYSRTYFQFLIEQGSVLVNGKQIKKRALPEVGDEIEICFLLTPELSLEPENIPLDILFEDEHLLAINKPAGMVVHPAPGHFSGTFVQALLFHCNLQRDAGDLRPGIVHRLDKETTGVLLAAKTMQAHEKLVSLFSSRKIQKHYLALCLGKPANVMIDAPIARHPTRRKEMAVCLDKGKEAITRLKLLEFKNSLSLIEVELVTGRTHQIRVHMKHIGSPVIGDPIYGSSSTNKKYGVARQFLHAQKLQFTHPFTGKTIALKAPLPADFSHFLSVQNFVTGCI
jgi:23S rRNA pseudouridine1911/1915/1917 synthase